MKIPPSSILFTALVFSIACLGIAVAEEEGGEKDWLEFYYENPRPEKFVEMMKDYAEDGTLENENAAPALIGFTSQVIRQNRDKLKEWYDALSGLSPEQKMILHTAMLYSRTTEADELMISMFGQQFEKQKVETQKILEMPLDKQNTIDMLWGFFYATGSEHAIRRVILCMRFDEAPEQPEGVKVPEGFEPLYAQLPAAAVNMLIANGERHPRVLEICERLYKEDDSLVPAEKRLLFKVLAELKPDAYPPEKAPVKSGDLPKKG